MGSVTPKKGVGVYVVHEHSATRHHWDLRLEIDGVLCSWAVPKAPSMNPDDKRLAVKVENHPLEYLDFEAVIPPGNYGAGPMIVWDRGLFLPLIDPADGLREGEIKFELRGYKLRGAFTLVHTGRSKRGRGGGAGSDDWLLIKKPDAHASAFLASGKPLPETSILSGLTVEELRGGADRIASICRELAARDLPVRAIASDRWKPMLACPGDGAFSSPDWLFELKYDGYRLIAFGGDGKATLRYRSGLDATARFPEIASAVRALPCKDVVLDGEVVVLDAEGLPRFGLLQDRAGINAHRDVVRAAALLPATFFVFDLPGCDGRDLRGLPLVERKALLQRLVPPAGPMRFADHVDGDGQGLFALIQARDLEGVIAKKKDSPYRSGQRSKDWLKIKTDPEGDFAVCGYTAPKGTRQGLGALYLCLRKGDSWVYASKVGSGFDEAQLASIKKALDGQPRWEPPFGKPDDVRGARWVEPTMVCTIRYREVLESEHGLSVRHAVFLRLRDDKVADECTVPDEAGDEGDAPAPSPEVTHDAPARELRLTNLGKVFWPDEGYTKGDLIAFYRSIAPWILPYLKDRPTVITRFPDGIAGKSFYQKDLPAWVPPWLRTTALWSEHSQREIHYTLIDDADGLAYLANLGTIPIHVWGSRIGDLGRPDWTIVDFDPKNAPIANVVPLTLAVHEVCEEIGLPNYVKTSGQTGLHILIPLGGQCTYDQARTLAYLLGLVVEHRHRDIATTNKNPRARGGRVYLDWGQNAPGQLLVSPFSVRPVRGAPVSMPLEWHEVVPGLDSTRWTIRDALDRMERLGHDPVLRVLDEKPDLIAALEKLQRMAPG
jgi:bifunctional non-homologous end joining protein LigD